MLGAVQVTLMCPTQASGIRVRDAIINYVAGLPPATAWKYDAPIATTKAGAWVVYAGLWYTDVAQAQSVFDRVQVLWSGGQYGNDINSGSQVRWHECREDEGDLDCSDAPGAYAIKA